MEPAVAVSALLPSPSRPVVRPPAPLVLRPDDVGGLPAWWVLLRDGVLQPVTADAAVPAAAVVTAQVRAAALTHRVRPRAVVVGTTALWVYCGGPLDDELHLAYRSSVFRLGAESHDVGGVRVTTPERTALDLASRLPHREALAAALALGRAGADLGAALLLLESRTRAVGRPQGRAVLRAARDRLARGPDAT